MPSRQSARCAVKGCRSRPHLVEWAPPLQPSVATPRMPSPGTGAATRRPLLIGATSEFPLSTEGLRDIDVRGSRARHWSVATGVRLAVSRQPVTAVCWPSSEASESGALNWQLTSIRSRSTFDGGSWTSMTSTSSPNDRFRPQRPDPDAVGADARRNRQARRLPPGAACVLCGEGEIAVLKQVKVKRSLLDGHHVFGQANEATVLAVLCPTCHAKATALQLDVGAMPPGGRGSHLEAMELALRSLGSFFELLADAMYRFAMYLGQAIASLDEYAPDWRTWQGMV